MDKQLKDPIPGPSTILSMDASRKLGSPWGPPKGTDAYHASTDASLFSSSLPVFPREKFNFTFSERGGQSIDDCFPALNKGNHEDASKDPFDDAEQSAVGSFLPGDEEELLAGIMEDFDLNELPSQMEDLEDDLFGSGGGMELDFGCQESVKIDMSMLSMNDGIPINGVGHYGLPNGVTTIAGEHPYGEHPSRTLFVRNINSNVEDSELRSLFEQYGDIRTLYTACKHRGFVMISYYDIRSARTAIRALQNKPLRRRKLDIHFSIPKDNPSEKDINQGTLVVFNLDPSVSNDDLRQIFGAYGEVKEIRETPHKRHHKFVEFYDVRAAEAALKALNRSDIAGKRIKLEPSRPGGARRNLMQQLNQELEQDDARSFRHQVGSPLTNSPPGNWPHFSSPVEHNPLQGFSQSSGLATPTSTKSNHFPGLASILPDQASSPTKIAPIGKNQGNIGHGTQVISNAKSMQGVGYQHPHLYTEQKLSASPGPISFGESSSSSSAIGTLSGPQFLWGSPTSYSECTNSSSWSTSKVGHPFANNAEGEGYLHSNQHGSILGSSNPHHVGSAPSVVHLDRHFGYFSELPESSFVNPVRYGGTGLGHKTASYLMNIGAHPAMSVGVAIPGNIIETGSPGSRMISLMGKGPMFVGNDTFQGFGMTCNEVLLEHGRSRRMEYNVNQIDSKKQYQLDLEKIKNGEDTRTTLMIKNIPNKYTSKMLLAAIDENHRGTYDFLYLPIDFKNKCNVGYAFINMLSPSHIIPFYEEFNGKKWEKFNSEKIASLAYARIQGKAALVLHFQNSSLMNEDKRCRPILFQSEGQDSVDQEPILSSNLNICIRQPDGSYSGDTLESPKGDPDEKLEKSLT
ncbi:hypothetical protein NMG60_11021069 [Bertholletia excelsa]